MEATEEDRAALLMGLDTLTAVSYVDEVEVFKTCLDYWALFVADIYSGASIPTTPGGGNHVPQPPPGTTLEEAARMQDAQGGGANGHAFAFPPAPGAAGAAGGAGAGKDGAGAGGALVSMQRRVVYGGVLQRLRALMINRMAKPEVRLLGLGWAGLAGCCRCGAGREVSPGPPLHTTLCTTINTTIIAHHHNNTTITTPPSTTTINSTPPSTTTINSTPSIQHHHQDNTTMYTIYINTTTYITFNRRSSSSRTSRARSCARR